MKNLLLGFFIIVGIPAMAQNLTADFSANVVEVCLGDQIAFTDLSTAGSSPIQTWTWDFGDGNASQNQNPTHTFTAAGTYNITLTVQAGNGTSDVEIKSGYITVHPLPTVSFALNGVGCSVPFNATFTNSSSSGSHSYDWDFGNSQTSTDHTPTGIVYQSTGTYTVSLTVTNTVTGCVNSFSDQIEIYDYQAVISATDTTCVGVSTLINDASPPGTNVWSWDFGDGTTSSAQQNNHVYTTTGTHTITLIAENTNGCIDTVTQTIVVGPAVTASFTADVTVGCNPTTVTFTNNSTGNTQSSWNFGDGSTYLGNTPPPHTYTQTGEFNVILVVTNDFGCSHMMFQVDYITIEDIDPGFIIAPQGGCTPLDVQFTDTTTVPNPGQDPIVSWDWDFGNGNTFSGQSPGLETYTTGTYDITLTVTTQSGCVETVIFEDSVYVGEIDTVGFTNFPIDVCAKESVNFNNLTNITVPHDPSEVEYTWSFGDGGSSAAENPSYNYDIDTGFFDVTLVVNFRECIETVTLSNAVHVNAPISNFSPLTSLVCNPASLPVTIDVIDNSIIGELPDDADMTWNWGDTTSTFFDDPDIDDADQGSTSHAYNNYGTYTIQQVINNLTTGCTDSSSVAITISYIDADFSFSNDSVCIGDQLTIADISTSSHFVLTDTTENYYLMGNGDTLETPNHVYTYPNSGSFDIIHVAYNSVGCVDTDTLFGMDVLALPTASATPDVSGGCAPLTVTFTNTSSVQGNGAPLDSFLWTYHDNTTQTTTNINQTVTDNFTTEGTFMTTIVATDAFGCQSSPYALNVDVTKPTSDFLVDSVVCDLENYTTFNQSTGAAPLDYEWFLDGNSAGTTTNYSGVFDEVASSSYNSVVHDLTLVTTDGNGCTDTLTTPVTVSMPHADANFTFSGATVNGQGEFVCPPVFAALTDTSSSYGAVTNWNWTLGNGNSSTLQNPNNTYVFAGTYTATMSITDEFGCTDDTTFLDYITINGPSGDPAWTSVGTICAPEFEFYVENQNGVTNVEWTLGDGNVINDTSLLVYAYDTTGNYQPSVIISDDFGCEIPYVLPPISVAINELDAFFTASMLQGEASEIFTFDDQSVSSADPIVDWYWDFTEYSQLNNTDADIQYGWNNLGYQTVTLTVSDANGCSDSYAMQVLITAEFVVPNVFTPNGDNINDIFQMDFDVFNGYHYVILNRWGNVMIENDNHDGIILWDGTTSSGNPAAEGVYFYKITGTRYDGVTISVHGNVTLVRD